MKFEDIQNRLEQLKQNPINVHPKIRGVIIGILDKACGSKENRYQFAKALGLPAHSKDWTDAEWYAVSQMVKIDKDPALGWIATNPNFTAIVGAVMAQVGKQEGQMEFIEKKTCPSCTWRGEIYLDDGVCPQCKVNWHELQMQDEQADRINGEA